MGTAPHGDSRAWHELKGALGMAADLRDLERRIGDGYERSARGETELAHALAFLQGRPDPMLDEVLKEAFRNALRRFAPKDADEAKRIEGLLARL
jgi:hypothetical protein